MNLSSKIRVAVLRGGPSDSYDASLKTGGHVLSTLKEMPKSYEPTDIFISKDGDWHLEGLVREPQHALQHIDVVWNALHGLYGRDGQVQRILEGLQIPFTGSSAVASTLSMNKDMAKRLYQQNSLLTPAHELITKENLDDDKLIAIFRSYLLPVIVKPAKASGSFGLSLAHTYQELKQKVKDTFAHFPRVLVEELVKGDEVTCGVIDKAKEEKLYALVPIYSDSTKRPSHLSVKENKSVEKMARRAHEVLGLHHYSDSDFIITPKRKIYILKTNSQPLLHKGSSMHQSLETTGWRQRDFVDHVLQLAV